jgi:hypothetical protein
MKELLLLFTVAIVLAIAGFFVYFQASVAPTLTGVGPVTMEPKVPIGQEEVDMGETGASTPLTMPASEDATGRSEVAADERPLWTREAGAKTRMGMVVVPEGTPGDEVITIEVAPSSLQGGDQEGGGEAVERESYEVEVAADGSFEYTEGADALTYRLKLKARYLFTDGTIKVDLAAETPAEPRFTPTLGAWISGQVLLPPGKTQTSDEWEDGEVRIGLDYTAGINAGAALASESFSRQVNLDDTGHFDMFGVPATPAFAFAIDLEAFPLYANGGHSVKAGEHQVIDTNLSVGVFLSGVVENELGEPIFGAVVTGIPGEMTDMLGQASSRYAVSNENGEFNLSGLPGRLIRVSASSDGYLTGADVRLELEDGDVRNDVRITMFEGGSIAGVVNGPSGKPIAGAEVDVSFDPAALNGLNAANAQKGASGRAETDAEGRFRITGLGGGPFLVEAEMEGDAWLFGRVDGVKPGATDLVIDLTVHPSLKGRVTNAAGEPVTSFEVEVRSASLGGLMSGDRHNKLIDHEDGLFEIERVKDGSWSLYIRAEGFGPAGPIAATRPGPGDEYLEIQVERGATVRGMVVNPDGDPVPMAVVTWMQDSGDTMLDMIGAGPTVTAAADQDGIFELSGLAAGELALSTTSADWAKAEPLVITLAPDEVVEGVRITLRAGGSIDGLFLNKEGEPSAGSMIQVMRTGGQDQNMTTTDQDGKFLVEHLEPGSWQVIGINGDISDATADPAAMMAKLEMDMVDVIDGETVELILGALPEDPVHLTGQINPGEDAAGGLAILVPEGKAMLGAMVFSPIAEDGSFEMDLDAPGVYVITIQTIPGGGIGQDNVEFVRTVPPGDQHHMVLDLPSGAITGRVTDGAGAALGGVRVSVYTDGGATTGTMSGGKYAESTTESDGTYSLPHLQPGTYTVGAGGRPLTSVFDSEADFGRVVRERVSVSEGSVADGVDFELLPAGSITGRVLDGAGIPLKGASLFVRDESGTLLERISMQTSSANGTFTYGGIAPGNYTITARGNLLATTSGVTVRVKSGEETETELQVSSATMLHITCVDGEGNPVIASIEVRDSSGMDQAGQFGMDDFTKLLSEEFSTTTTQVGPLPPGKYKVIANMGDLTVTKSVSVKGQESRKVTVRLR